MDDIYIDTLNISIISL